MEDLKELAAALSRAQGKIDNVKKTNLNPHFKSKYADLASVWDVVREPFTSEGLSIVQLPVKAPEGHVGLGTALYHSSGQTIGSEFFLALKDASNPQVAGSALTYMKRYALLGLAGIAPEDDDGNVAAGKPGPVPGGASNGTDWEAAGKSAIANLAKLATGPEKRALYAQVRNSAMPEPGKTALLTTMGDSIRAFETTEKKEKK